jgi:CRISPR system Cascade subunit CasB
MATRFRRGVKMNSEVTADTGTATVGGLVARLARRLGDPAFPTGDHAALRRLSTDGPELRHAVALYRLMEDVGISASYTDQVRRWATIVNALALCRGAHDPDRFCGAALQAASFSEERLAALLAADRDTLIDLLPRVARRLAATGERMDWRPLARLLLDVGRNDARADEIRSRIAREYVRAQSRASSESPQPAS